MPDLYKPKVAIAWVHDDDGRVTSFEDSVDALRDYDSMNAGILHSKITVRYGTDGLTAARNTIVAQFLESEADWLFMVDCDMGFRSDALYRLLEAAHPVDRPIMGGLCFSNRQTSYDGMYGFRTKPSPTIFDWGSDPETGQEGFLVSMVYPVNAVVRCAATGAAFLVIHRSVFERIAQTPIPGTDLTIGPSWFDKTRDSTGQLLGEDISFCVRANLARIPVHVHTGVRTTHFKPIWLQEQDHWRTYVPPFADSEIAVVVPVKGTKNAEAFMHSLRATTGMATVYAVVTEGFPETAQAWRDAGAEVIVDKARSFARKVKAGVAKTSQPWLLITGDDVTFRPGWLDHAEHVADVLEADVVGCNGLHDPDEAAGVSSQQLLVRRSYLDGVEAPEMVRDRAGWCSWLVDGAKKTGKWQMALGSHVEREVPAEVTP